MEELVKAGADTFVRVGTCGGMDIDVKSGDLVIATGADPQMKGPAGNIPIEFPAVADIDVVNALDCGGKESSHDWHKGIVQCKKDSFTDSMNRKSCPSAMSWKINGRRGCAFGCKASEMESRGTLCGCGII